MNLVMMHWPQSTVTDLQCHLILIVTSGIRKLQIVHCKSFTALQRRASVDIECRKVKLVSFNAGSADRKSVV